MIYAKPADVPWEAARWPNFSAAEFACRHCGECYHDPRTLDRLQLARWAIDKPFKITSGHRCHIHNRNVGGAPASQHLKLAVDISLHDHDRHALKAALRFAGFTGFGFYRSFIHVDLGPPRAWFGAGAKASWQ